MREGKESGRGLNLWVGAGLFVGTVLVFAPALRLGFIDRFDDGEYVTRNPIISQGLTRAGLWYALTASVVANWHPVTVLSHMVDAELYGLAPWGHHLTNVLLHALAVSLLFVMLRSLTGAVWPSAFTAALFAVHPMRVESVAWVAERKDVLSACFWLLTTLAYVRYVRGPGARRYAVMAALFALGLMAKPVLVTLPLTLLLLDFWPLNRLTGNPFSPGNIRDWAQLVKEKVPLLALSAVSCVVTLLAQRAMGAVTPGNVMPMELRVMNAALSYVKYIVKLAWPTGLAVFYPLSLLSPPPLWQVLAAAGLLAVVTGLAVRYATQFPYWCVGWFWYLGTLVPVIGIVQVGSQAMADRYSYIPSIGIFIALVWGASEALRFAGKGRIIAALCAAAALICLSAVTWVQLGYWQNTETVFRRALAVTKDNWTAHHNLGCELRDQGRFDEAEHHLAEAIRLRPDWQLGYVVMGRLYYRKGEYLKAAEYFAQAYRLLPGYGMAHMEAGLALEKAGRREEALKEFRQAAVYFQDDLLRCEPTNVTPRLNLAFVFERLGKKREALQQYEEVLRIDAEMPVAREAAARLKSATGG